MNHPSYYYIRYLLSKRSLGAETIVSHLHGLGLPVPSDPEEYVSFTDAIRKQGKEMPFPPGYNPRHLVHRPTYEFLKEEKIYDIWDEDPYVFAAFDLLDMKPVRQSVEIMLLGPITYAGISRRIQVRWGFSDHEINPRVIRNYAHYFWNFHFLDKDEWMTMLRTWHSSAGDGHIHSLLAPRNKTGAAYAIWVAEGGTGNQLRDTDVFSMMKSVLFQHFIHVSANKPGYSTSCALQILATSFKDMATELDMRRGGSADVLDELRRLEAEYDTNPMKSAKELPGVQPRSYLDAVGEEVEQDD